jgi:hypothetical protein
MPIRVVPRAWGKERVPLWHRPKVRKRAGWVKCTPDRGRPGLWRPNVDVLTPQGCPQVGRVVMWS